MNTIEKSDTQDTHLHGIDLHGKWSCAFDQLGKALRPQPAIASGFDEAASGISFSATIDAAIGTFLSPK